MKPTTKPKRTAEQRAEEEAVRPQHPATPVRERPAGTLNRQIFAATLRLVARFKAARERQGLTLAEVAERMGIDAPALSRLETGKMLNPTLATLHKWAEALGRKLEAELSSGRNERTSSSGQNMANELPQQSAVDYLHLAARTGIAAIPMFGGSALELFNQII